ncbi:MAG: hypothetical protein V7L22_26245 [Nostoc sp.]
MNLQEVKNQFPEAVGEIETLERLGFASRSGNWIDTLDFEKAQTACWLVGRVGIVSSLPPLIRVCPDELIATARTPKVTFLCPVSV